VILDLPTALKEREVRAGRRLALLSLDMGHHFERILKAWGAGSVIRQGRSFTAADDLPMERMALLSGTLKGILVMRSSREFPDWLKGLRAGLVPPGTGGAEAFEELLTLFAIYLYHDFWTPESFTIGPIRPFPSIRMDWPPEDPTALQACVVEGHRVEVRLWRTA